MKRSFFLLASCAAVFSLPAQDAAAGNWDVDTKINQEVVYHSNQQMLITNEKETYGSITTPSITIKSKTPTSGVLIDSSIQQNLFNDSSYNSTDLYTNARLSKKIQRWEAALGANVDYNTTRSSEVTTFGIDTHNDRHLGYAFTPEITFSPSVKDSLSISGGLNVSRYEDTTRNTNYNVYSSSFSWGHALTEFSTGFFSFNARRYQAQNDTDETVDSAGPSLGWRYQASENFSTVLSVGTEASRQEQNGGTTNNKWTWSSVFSGSLNYKNEQHDFTVQASRQQQPYSNGSSSLLTSISFAEAYKFNELFTGRVGAQYQGSKQSSLSSSNLKSRINANAGLSYRLTEAADIGASYRYKQEKLTNTSSTQKDNTALLSITYRPSF